MEAPEKIYLFENPISGYPDDRWLRSRSGEDDVEYTNTDAFFDKAWDYNMSHFYILNILKIICKENKLWKH